MREDQDPYGQIYGDTTSGSSSTPAADPWSADELSQAQAWAQDYYTSHKIPQGYGQWQDLLNNYQAQRRNGVGHQAAMDAVPGLLGWDKYQAPTPDQPGPAPTPAPDGSIGSLIAPFTGTFTAPPQAGLPDTPTFTPPGYNKPAPFSYEKFQGPDAQTVLNDPGYQFRLGQGQKALEQSAAAKGTLNGGATQKGVLQYGQDYASNEFNNVWNRDLSAYNTNYGTALGNYMTNYQTQYLDPYKFAYQGAQDAFAPQMVGYSTQAAFNQHQNDSDLNSAWAQYQQAISNFRDQRDSTFNKKFAVAGS